MVKNANSKTNADKHCESNLKYCAVKNDKDNIDKQRAVLNCIADSVPKKTGKSKPNTHAAITTKPMTWIKTGAIVVSNSLKLSKLPIMVF